MVCSRSKGKRGELEWVNYLKAHSVDARRSQQYCGAAGDADVITPELPIHWEVKRVQKLNIDRAMAQAIEDAEITGCTPVVAHRRDRAEWLVTLRAEDFLKILGK